MYDFFGLKGQYVHPIQPSYLKSDLVIIVHGNSLQYTWYSELQNHLASYGFATVSIEWDVSNYEFEFYENDFADLLMQHLEYLYNVYYWSSGKLTDNVNLVGHSRGAMAVIQHAYVVKDFQKNLMSIVSAAPALMSYHENDTYSNFNNTKSVLFLYGSHDDDIYGYGSPGNYFTPFNLYDKHAGNYSYLGYSRPDKDMIHFIGRRHGLFLDDILPIPQESKANAIAYTLAYLKLHSSGIESYRQFFKFQKRFSQMDPGFEVHQQHSDGTKLVISNFQNNNENLSSMGGEIQYNNVIKSVGNAWSGAVDSGSPHITKVLKLYWNRDSQFPFYGVNPFVQFKIPEANKDWSQFNYISFRVQQRNNKVLNREDRNQDFHLSIRDGQFNHRNLKISDYGVIPWLVTHESPSYDSPIVGGMNSIIIPLSEFDGVDMRDIYDIRFRFGLDTPRKGSIILDSIELYY